MGMDDLITLDFRQRYVYFVIPRKLLQLETATLSKLWDLEVLFAL